MADAISLKGTGVSGTGVLRNLSGSNAVTGLVTMTGDTKTQSDAGTLSLSPSSGNAITGAYNLSFNGAGNSTVAGPIATGAGTLTKLGTGILILSGTNPYTGDTTISAGTLQLGNGGSTGTLASANVIDNGTLVFNFGADTSVAANISGLGDVQVIGASKTLFSSFLTTTAQNIASNTTVAEVLYRLSGARENGTTVPGQLEAGIYNKSFDPLTNTATFQVQLYDGTYTKAVFVKLTQSGTNVQATIDNSNNTGTWG